MPDLPFRETACRGESAAFGRGSLFAVGELPGKYEGWELLRHFEGTSADEHPGGARHEHACERVVARKPR